MKVCPNCQTTYPDDANFCPQEACATPQGPCRLEALPASAAERPGQGRYTLEQQIGGHRSGPVFRARDTQTGTTVVYKQITRAVLTSAPVVERSQRELKQLQRAQSPRVAKVIDFGKEPDGQLFIVTELVEGQTLDKVVAASGVFGLDRAKRIIAQIGDALLEGQKVGVVHHDLAPKNVLVGAGDAVKVINFVAPVPITQTVFGVAEYLSPEQAEGRLVDQRSNTYSLAGILMFMLTGQAPVEGPTPAAVMEQVLKGTVVPPSQRAQGVNPELDRVVMKAMDKSPNRRPLTLRQFLTDVAGLTTSPANAEPARAGGFAKTMMFSGGSPEAQKLVNQALAARAEANGSAPPQRGPNVTAPIARVASELHADPGVTPPPVRAPGGEAPASRHTHGAAIAATMVALPAAGKLPGAAARPAFEADSQMATTPPPVAQVPVPQAAPTPGAPAPGAGAPAPGGRGPAPVKSGGAAAFRETLWFKQGDVDQMVADARAKLDASRAKGTPAPVEPELPAVETKPLEERYRDDGSVSVEDRKKYSLRVGATSAALPAVGGAVPGERMSAEEMMGEIGSGKRVVIVIVALAVVLAVVVGLVWMFRGRHVAQSAAAMTPQAVPTQPMAPPPPTPAPPAAKVPTPAAAAPATAPAPAAADAPHKAEAKSETKPEATTEEKTEAKSEANTEDEARPAPRHSSSAKKRAAKRSKSSRAKKHR